MLFSYVMVFVIVSASSTHPCDADKNEEQSKAFMDKHPEISSELNKIPVESFDTLYKIHVNSGIFKASNMTLAGAAAFALSRFCSKTKGFVWAIGKRNSFKKLYGDRVLKSCEQVKTIYNKFGVPIDKFLSINESALTLTRVGSLKSIAEKCLVLAEPKCFNAAFDDFDAEILRLKRIGLC